MQEHPTNLPAFDQWIGQFACPACHAALRAQAGSIVCTGCGRVFPVIDGIPVLIVERAQDSR